MTVFNSLKVSVLITLLVAGLIAGLSLAGTDLVNPNTSKANAENIRIATSHQQVMNQLQEQLEQAKAQAEIAEIEAQKQASLEQLALQQDYERNLKMRQLDAYERRMKILESLMIVIGICLILILPVVAITAIIKTKKTSTVPASHPVRQPMQLFTLSTAVRPTRAPEYKQMRVNARQREILARHIALHNASVTGTQVRMNREQYQKLPHAE